MSGKSKRPRLKTLPSRLASVADRLKSMPAQTQRTRGLHTGSAQWRRLREMVLLRDNYTCADCKRLVVGKEAHVDHIDGDSHNQQLSNLACRCINCHSAKTAREDRGFGNGRG